MKEVPIRFIFVPLTCLALVVTVSPLMAKDKKPDKQMDMQGCDGDLRETGYARRTS